MEGMIYIITVAIILALIALYQVRNNKFLIQDRLSDIYVEDLKKSLRVGSKMVYGGELYRYTRVGNNKMWEKVEK